VKNRMSVSRCCCACTDCCNGSWPDEYDVEFSFTNGMCSTCASIDGVYTLAKVPDVCSWRYDSGTISQSCDPPYGITINRITVDLSIRCINATQYRIDLVFTIYGADPCLTPTGAIAWQQFSWRKVVNVADFACAEADAESISYLTRARSIAAWICALGGGAFLTVPFDYICTTTSAATITAVP